MAIPEAFLEELNERVDLVDVASGYTTLQKKGNRYWGCCPFHSEKTPSFSITPEKQMYYCFGCHKGGHLINFVMEAEGVGFVDAVGILAQRAGMPMPEDNGNPGEAKKRERLLNLNKEAARYFHANLTGPQGQQGRDYFAQRGLSKRTVTNFGLGYALPQEDGWDRLIQAMTERGYTKLELLEAGLAVQSKKGGVYDRFRGRVMFPIIDLRGNVIGFGGRVLDDSTPKYLNSPDTVIYNKSKNLFALNLAKKSKAGYLILTEGYMDTIALHQGGFDCAVASLGTSLTENHARLLAKYTKEVVISYDGDQAGINAAQRAIGLLNKTGVNVRVLRVTGAKDPDEYIKKYGHNAFQRLIDGAAGQIPYRIGQIQQKYDLTADDQKVQYLQEAADLLARLSSPVEREIYGAQAAEAAGIDKAAMLSEVERQRSRLGWQQKKQADRKALTPAAENQPTERQFRYRNVRSAMAEEGVVRLLLLEPQLFPQAEGLRQEEFSSQVLGKVFGILQSRWEEGKDTPIEVLGSLLDNQEMSHIATIAQKPESLQNSEAALADYIRTIQTEHMKDGVADDSDLLAVSSRKRTEDAP
ncbi:MAG: DNA primase [Clostridiales bacterium]|nr:DNA primase [Clostridiales bacterium]